MLTTGLEFRLRHKADDGELMRHEHVNIALEIEGVLRHFFANMRVRCFGLSRRTSTAASPTCGAGSWHHGAAFPFGHVRQRALRIE